MGALRSGHAGRYQERLLVAAEPGPIAFDRGESRVVQAMPDRPAIAGCDCRRSLREGGAGAGAIALTIDQSTSRTAWLAFRSTLLDPPRARWRAERHRRNTQC